LARKYKIAVLLLGRFGDLVLSTPMLKKLSTIAVDGRIDLICGANNYKLLANEPYAGNICVLDKRPHKLFPFILKLISKKYDIFLDPKDHRSSESRIISNLVRAEKKIGYRDNHDGFDEFLEPLDNHSGHTQRKSHHSAKMMNAVSTLFLTDSIDKTGYIPELTVGDIEKSRTEDFLHGNSIKNYIAFNISASSEKRYASIEFWKSFFQNVEIDYPLLLIYAPSESGMAAKLIKELESNQRVYDFGVNSFTDIIALISRAKLLISPDTAVVHVAAAFDVPVFGLFSWYESQTKSFYPLSSSKIILWSKQGDEGVRSITSEEAIAAWQQEGHKLLKKQK
jgi:ADP-heptose:LPS heptosyltransferase